NLSSERESRVAPFAVKHNFMISTFDYYSYAHNPIKVWMMAGRWLKNTALARHSFPVPETFLWKKGIINIFRQDC
ncbi:MAG: hypothetical protein Q7J03_07740, partial [Methanoregula sp.]|nr:hypothetical protein [Methanoregula sp.]